MHAVVRRVPDVVHEVARARRRAVGGEGGERFTPPAEIAELGGEDDPRKEEQVLRPLSWPQRDEHSAKSRPRARELVDRCGLGYRHADGRLVGARRKNELEATALARAGVELDAP